MQQNTFPPSSSSIALSPLQSSSWTGYRPFKMCKYHLGAILMLGNASRQSTGSVDSPNNHKWDLFFLTLGDTRGSHLLKDRSVPLLSRMVPGFLKTLADAISPVPFSSYVTLLSCENSDLGNVCLDLSPVKATDERKLGGALKVLIADKLVPCRFQCWKLFMVCCIR